MKIGVEEILQPSNGREEEEILANTK